MSLDVGILMLRLVVGLFFMGHGSQKLFGWFGGDGLEGFAGMLGSLGIRPAAFWAYMGGLSEFCGGLLLALGFLNPLGSLAIISSMLVAIFMVHWPKVWAQESGLEYPLVNVAAASCLALGGMGLFSMDAALSIRLPSTAMFVVGLAFVLAGAGYVMSTASRPVLAVPVLTPEELEEEAEERRVA